MNISDIITYVMIAAAVAYFVVRDVRLRRGKAGCSCGCSCGCGCNCACNCSCSCGANCKCENCNCGCHNRS